GSIAVDSTRGKGTRFTIRLPFTVSVNRALMVSIGGDIFAIPINTVEGVVRVSPYELEVYYQPDAPPFEYANQSYSLNYLGTLLRTSLSPHLEGQTEPRPVLLARGTDRPTAVQIDSILGSREIVVKALGPQFSHVHGLSGATVLGDGSVVVIVDIPALVRSELQRGRDLALEQSAQRIEQRNRLVMVVDDSVTVRKVTSRLLERQGFDVMLAKDGVDAVTQLQTCEQLPDVMLLDIEMPRMDGFEVASRVRHTSRLQDIPIIMITSRTGDKHRERAYNLGVNKYLGKPYQEITLLQAISEVSDEAVES
ncbi:response regulator, partial [Litorivivens sp.]